ncbi:beta-ketoacyl-ACP synthase 3 [Streptomyces fumanus]|uniref:beta-ketoacyl-ACP synthase 3 n=1 Tax=Streptomyces fumanus TaxID=67302 RepID=UPI003406C8EA
MTAPASDGVPAAVLCGLGSWLPSTVVPNDELAGPLGVSDAWIHQRSGVRSRRRVDDGTATVALAAEAGARALKSQGHGQVDAVLLATATPDRVTPPCAPEVAARLGLSGAAAVDLSAACSGFVYGLSLAAGCIAARTFARVLVIGAETMSAVVDPRDPVTGPIFGDGAAAAVVRAGRPGEPGAFGPFALGSDGGGADLIQVPRGGSRTRYRYTAEEPRARVRMDGREVFRRALEHLGGALTRAVEKAGWTPAEVDRFAIHQANARISRSLATRMKVPEERWLSNIEHVGNTSAASVPLLLDHAVRDGALAPGQRVAVAAFGAGLTWGATTLVWPDLAAGG